MANFNGQLWSGGTFETVRFEVHRCNVNCVEMVGRASRDSTKCGVQRARYNEVLHLEGRKIATMDPCSKLSHHAFIKATNSNGKINRRFGASRCYLVV